MVRRAGNTANLLTFDIEGFIEASYDSVNVPQKYCSSRDEAHEILTNVEAILDLLGESRQGATFFILGRIARDMPALVRRIAEGGHEIACHSLTHDRLFKFDRATTEERLRDAKRYLEDASGGEVIGFRAPDFSIARKNLWVFDVLMELGFVYDSSIYPTHLHDVYGIGDFPRTTLRLPNGLVEVPLSTVSFFGQRIPFGGGGYLRLYPFPFTRLCFSALNFRGVPVIVYLHPFEMGKVVPRITELGALRKLRTYGGVAGARSKLKKLLGAYRFVKVIDYLRQKGFTNE